MALNAQKSVEASQLKDFFPGVKKASQTLSLFLQKKYFNDEKSQDNKDNLEDIPLERIEIDLGGDVSQEIFDDLISNQPNLTTLVIKNATTLKKISFDKLPHLKCLEIVDCRHLSGEDIQLLNN